MRVTMTIVLAMMAFSCGGESDTGRESDAGNALDADAACVPGDFGCLGTTSVICNEQGEWTPTLAPYCDGTVRE